MSNDSELQLNKIAQPAGCNLLAAVPCPECDGTGYCG
jgi:hypothetical protein